MQNKTKFMGIQNLNLGEEKDELAPSQLMVNTSQAPISSSKYIVESLIKKADSIINYVNTCSGSKSKLTKAVEVLHGLVQEADSFSVISHLRILLATNEFDLFEQATCHPIVAPIITYLALKIENVPFYLDWNIMVMRQKRLFMKPKYGYNINWVYTQENPYTDSTPEQSIE
jgi:hypothetical protein